jgi:hypothetical protein
VLDEVVVEDEAEGPAPPVNAPPVPASLELAPPAPVADVVSPPPPAPPSDGNEIG